MKVLIEISHPARVHLFRNYYKELVNKGHEVVIVAVEKDRSIELLNLYNIPYIIAGTNRKGSFNKLIELFKTFFKTLKHARIFDPDIFIGGASPVLAYVSFILRKPYISVSDTEHAKLTWLLTKPFITKILTPKGFLKDFGSKHVRFNGYKELAYLHPNFFKPDPSVFELLDIERNRKFVLLRFISWDAHHDTGHYGISEEIKFKAVKEFSKYAKVFISSEAKLPETLGKYKINIPVHKMHDVLYYASLFFGESGTMATESAILGTPTVRVSSLAKLLGNFKEMREEFQLVEFYDSGKVGLERALELLKDDSSKEEWREKSKVMLQNKIDVTNYLVNYTFKELN